MRRRRRVVVAGVVVLLSVVVAGLLGGVVGPGVGSERNPYPRRLVFADEFNGAKGARPDPAVWNIVQNADATDTEKQCYTDSPNNISTDGEGHLALTAQLYEGNCSDGWYRYYTSGRMNTKDKFNLTYGRIEVRAQVPGGVGMWPTVWAIGDVKDPWPTAGEIDVLETTGRLPTKVIGTIHGPQRGDASQQFFLQADLDTPTPVADAFHTYGVVWTPDRLTWTLDGKSYGSVTKQQADAAGRWVWNHPYYLIMNLAVGGVYGGEVPDSTVFPQRLLVDWIRIYQ